MAKGLRPATSRDSRTVDDETNDGGQWEFRSHNVFVRSDDELSTALREKVVIGVQRALGGISRACSAQVIVEKMTARLSLNIGANRSEYLGSGDDANEAVDDLLHLLERDPGLLLENTLGVDQAPVDGPPNENVASPNKDIVSRALQALDYKTLYLASASSRIEAVKSGVPAADVARIARSMGTPTANIIRTLTLAQSTIDRKARAGELLSAEQSEKVVGLARLIGQVQAMVEESGEPAGFNAAHWLSDWLDSPLPALNGKRPAEYMDTAEGRDLVGSLLMMMQSGAYA